MPALPWSRGRAPGSSVDHSPAGVLTWICGPQCTGRSTRDVKAAVHKLGDLGMVAEASKSTQSVLFTPARLTVKKVFTNLLAIANMSGNKSQNKKVQPAAVVPCGCGCDATPLLEAARPVSSPRRQWAQEDM